MRWMRLKECQKACTVAGWTPGLSQLVRAEHYPCGCVAGVYETRRKELAEIVDAVSPDCRNPNHVENIVVHLRSPMSPAGAASASGRSSEVVHARTRRRL
jgi:hypothetical protein